MYSLVWQMDIYGNGKENFDCLYGNKIKVNSY